MFDITKLPAHYVATYGRDKIIEVSGATSQNFSIWEKSGRFPLDMVQKMLEFDPAPLSEVRPLYENPPVGTKLCILVPLSGPPQPKMMDCILRLYDRANMGYHRVAFNNLSVARNSAAAWALRGGYEWILWHDGDNIVPCGDAEWYREAAELPRLSDVFAGLNSINRLLAHKLKLGLPANIVSCCYVGRKKGAAPQFGGGETAQGRGDVRVGPRDVLREVPWVGFGFVLTHRSVFEDIIKTQGDEIRMKPGGIGDRFGYQYAFFNPLDLETCGDDVPFAHRAAIAGHKCYVDMAVMGAHIGDRAYTYADL